jgi:hypothetical protein
MSNIFLPTTAIFLSVLASVGVNYATGEDHSFVAQALTPAVLICASLLATFVIGITMARVQAEGDRAPDERRQLRSITDRIQQGGSVSARDWRRSVDTATKLLSEGHDAQTAARALTFRTWRRKNRRITVLSIASACLNLFFGTMAVRAVDPATIPLAPTAGISFAASVLSVTTLIVRWASIRRIRWLDGEYVVERASLGLDILRENRPAQKSRIHRAIRELLRDTAAG